MIFRTKPYRAYPTLNPHQTQNPTSSRSWGFYHLTVLQIILQQQTHNGDQIDLWSQI